MKLIYSELQKLIPSLNVEPQKLRDDLTMIGHFTNYFEEIEGEIVFDLDIKVNRGDCLGYYGLARDLSVYYNLPLVTPDCVIASAAKQSLPIEIKTSNATRVMAVKISNLKNTISPEWLQKFVRIHGANSINTLVDLTNYIMFFYGLPNHAFDTAKSGDHLIWEMNPHHSEFVSLDGTKLPLNNDILMVNSPDKPLSLSFWGGESCAIDLNTTETIVEIAVYNPAVVRQNSRQLKATTEAATRLEKSLDPELIPLAINHLASLITENLGGQVTSEIFDYYPHPVSLPQITFDPQLPSRTSGISIPTEFALDCLTRLGCTIKNDLVVPPSIRTDITLEEDLVEEVVRFFGYYNIPTNQPLTFKSLSDITPPEIYLIDELKDKLVALGYDEVLTWPLVSAPVDPKTVITTQNSINSESIYLRQSLIPSLKQQLDQYSRFKLPNPQFFEIGKVFNLLDGQFIEQNSLAIYNSQNLQSDLSKLNLTATKIEDNFAEIILDNLPKPHAYTPQVINNAAIELTSQIITLDANVTLEGSQDPLELIKKYTALIDKNILWSIEIVDIYQTRYTFRVCYYNCDDKTAKQIHLSVFKLK